MADVPENPATETQPTEAQATVKWDDSRMETFFANIVNIQSTGDQVDVFFGTNKTWNIGGDREVKIELNSRVILTPHTAKRMLLALGRVIEEHEKRHGPLNVSR